MAFHNLKPGDVFEVAAKGERVRLACCDCGLVHNIAFALEKSGKIGIALERDQKATLAYRKRRKIIVRKNGKKIPE